MAWSVMNLRRSLAFIAACLILFPHSIFAQTRHALVVGIDDYANAEALKKARSDARAVHSEMQRAGFEATLLLNTDQIGFLTEISAFANRVQPGDDAVFFFAGHGVEVMGTNYLLPSDIPKIEPGQELVLTSRAVAVDAILEALQGRGARVSLLILDACRDNPFSRGGKRSIGGTRGLARASPTEGSFILYSAGEGETALDRLSNNDPNPNSVFTRSFLKALAEPGVPIRDLAQRVRSETRSLARSVNHSQFPAVYDQLDGDFIFLTGATRKNTPPMDATAAQQADDPCLVARGDWKVLETSDSLAALTAFIEQNAACPVMVVLAKDRITSLSQKSASSEKDHCTKGAEAWGLMATVEDANALRRFLEMYPDCGRHSVQARARLDKLDVVTKENALNLSLADLARIRLQLYWKGELFFAPSNTRAKDATGYLSNEERSALDNLFAAGVLQRTSSKAPAIERRYLSAENVAQILALPLTPHRPTIGGIGGSAQMVEVTGSWRSEKSGTSCLTISDAQTMTSQLVPIYPYVSFRAWEDQAGLSIGHSFATPNVFAVGTNVLLEIDGKTFPLNSSEESLRLPTNSDGKSIDNGAFVAMKRGRTMTIKGINALTKEPMLLTYGLDGFTAAFTRMSKLCGKPDLVKWLR